MVNLLPKDSEDGKIPIGWPEWMKIPRTKDRMHAKCPKCGKITSVRICYNCKEIMCEECLLEHHVECLRKSV